MEKLLASGKNPYKIIQGHRRGVSNLLYCVNDKYLYVKKKVHNRSGKEDWICYQEILCKSDPAAIPCTKRILYDPKTTDCTDKQIAHSLHPNHELIVKDLLSRNKILDDIVAMKDMCQDLSINVPANDIFTREIAKRPLGETKLRYHKMERNLRRYTSTKYPRIPKTVDEVINAYEDPSVAQNFGQNLRKTEQFYIDTVQIEPNSAFTVFASHQLLNLVKKHVPFDEHFILMDGTFDVAPIGYYQLLVIYILYKNDVFPLFYVLMTGKSAELYNEVFNFIEERNLFKINPKASFMVDFEGGLRKAIKDSYPESKLHGCWYHYQASLRRKFRSLHMLRLIADDEDAKEIYRKLLSLPLLPVDSIEIGYNQIKKEAREKKLSQEFRRFFKYFENYWTQLNQTNSLSVANLPMRTTSSLEGFNSVLNRTIAKHPNFFKFVERLRIHESRKADDMIALVQDPVSKKQLEPKHKKDKDRNDKIKHFTDLLCAHKLTVADFLDAITSSNDVDVHDFYYPESDLSDESEGYEDSSDSEDE